MLRNRVVCLEPQRHRVTEIHGGAKTIISDLLWPGTHGATARAMPSVFLCVSVPLWFKDAALDDAAVARIA